MSGSMVQSIVRNRWAFVPVAMLSTVVIAAALLVTLVVNERNATAAEPDSYRKGAAWDEWKEQLAHNGALRWVLTPEFVPSQTGSGLARLELAVADKHAIPIEGAAVAVEVVPIRDADSRVQLALAESSPGRYAVDVPLRTGGLWELRVTVDWKGKRYCDRIRRSVSFGRAQP